MMSYNPGVSYHGDAYIMQAGQNILNGRNAALNTLMQWGQQQADKHNEREELAGVMDGLRRWGEQGGGEQQPEVWDANGQPMQAQGDAGAGGGTVEEGMDPAAKQGKEARLLRKVMTHSSPDMGDAVEGMSTERLRGVLKGWALGQQQDGERAKAQEHAARMRLYMAQEEERQNRVASEATTGEFMKNLFTAPDVTAEEGVGAGEFGPPNRVTRPSTVREATKWAAAQTPNLRSRDWGGVASMIKNYSEVVNENGGADPQFVANTTLVPGQALTGMRGSKQWQALPTGQMGVQLLDDGNGNQIPVVMGPRGNPQQLRAPTAKSVPESYHKAMDELGTALAETQSNLEMTDDEIKTKASWKGTPEGYRKVQARVLESLQQRTKQTVDRYHSTGFLTDDARDQGYAEAGLTAPAGAAGDAKSAAAGSGPKVVSREMAHEFLKRAGGDRNKARALARSEGYQF